MESMKIDGLETLGKNAKKGLIFTTIFLLASLITIQVLFKEEGNFAIVTAMGILTFLFWVVAGTTFIIYSLKYGVILLLPFFIIRKFKGDEISRKFLESKINDWKKYFSVPRLVLWIIAGLLPLILTIIIILVAIFPINK